MRGAKCTRKYSSLRYYLYYHNFLSMTPNERRLARTIRGTIDNRGCRARQVAEQKQVGQMRGGEKGHLLYLCVCTQPAGCNLMSFLCWFRFQRVTRLLRIPSHSSTSLSFSLSPSLLFFLPLSLSLIHVLYPSSSSVITSIITDAYISAKDLFAGSCIKIQSQRVTNQPLSSSRI